MAVDWSIYFSIFQEQWALNTNELHITRYYGETALHFYKYTAPLPPQFAQAQFASGTMAKLSLNNLGKVPVHPACTPPIHTGFTPRTSYKPTRSPYLLGLSLRMCSIVSHFWPSPDCPLNSSPHTHTTKNSNANMNLASYLHQATVAVWHC